MESFSLAFVRKDSPLRSQAAFFNSDQLADYLSSPSKLRGTLIQSYSRRVASHSR
jgi:hypothetical protein